MPGMKRDCGGAAAILGAFKAVVKQVGCRDAIIFSQYIYIKLVGCALISSIKLKHLKLKIEI